MLSKETVKPYWHRSTGFKKVLDEKEVSNDTILTGIEGGFESSALAIQLQLQKPASLGELFKIASGAVIVKRNTAKLAKKRDTSQKQKDKTLNNNSSSQHNQTKG